MIIHGPEFDNFVVEPGMELEAFDMKQKDEIFLNHPFKILMFYLGKHPPYYSRWDGIDLCDFYFKMLDDYNRYGISFRREDNVYDLDNCLYVVENDNSKKDKWELHFKSKYVLLYRNCYNLKTLLFNKVKKINLDDYDRENDVFRKSGKHPNLLKKPSENDEVKTPSSPVLFEGNIFGGLEFIEPSERVNIKKTPSEWEFLEKISCNKENKISEWEYIKRKAIKEQKNKYLQVALMDPKIYNNESFFEDLIFSKLDDYNGEFERYPSLSFTNKKYDEYFKKTFKIIIEMIKRINYLIEKGNSEYLGILD